MVNKDKKEVSFGERESDGYAKVFVDGKDICKIYVLTKEQVNEIERLKSEMKIETNLNTNKQ